MTFAETPNPKTLGRTERVRAFGVVGSSILAGLIVFGGCRSTTPAPPPQEWDEESFGPLVPHDTFPGDCSLCHLPERWDLLRDDFHFDHAAETGFELVGAHEAASCLRCHNDRGPVDVYVARGCGGCHADPHEATLGLDCTRCHEESDWLPRGVIAEHARTRFALVGAHAAMPCERCHLQADAKIFTGLPVECALCHQADLARAASPDHIAAGWIDDCQRCHTPRADWRGAGFSHAIFPLTGAHAVADCSDCHQGNVFRGTPRDCFACHADDYAAAGDPNHVVGGFPTDCQLCHTTEAWEGAFFQHTFFPIDSGPHSGLDCSECHLGNSFGAFTCVDCHAHTRSDMDDEHDDVGGYLYSSPACLACHPDGHE